MRVGIVGGGLVGLATAHYLRKLGADPVVVEAGGVGGGCSRGNNGWVCPSVSTPLPAPGLTAKSLLWMLRRASHFHIPAAALPRLAPWLLRFRAHCTESARAHGIRALASLNAVTGELYDELAADGVEFERGRSGILFAYRDPALRDEKVKDIETVAAKSGASWRELDGNEVYGMEPLLRPGFSSGIHVETDRHVRPESLTEGLAAALRAGGAEIFEGTMVLGFEWDGVGTRRIGRTSKWASAGAMRVRTSRWAPGAVREGSRVRAIVTSRGDLEVDAVVLAAGAQTGTLVRMAGWRI
ncbi:MAG: FAD-dependent oxidoreductase, partial [Gemmatimonadetes bacterium]|nr:FAD-dependent oxidoreductase [Gemmatimonadota bacterium]